MGVISRGFGRSREPEDSRLPPGQYLTEDFPVLSAGPTPVVRLDEWRLDLIGPAGDRASWTWPELRALPHEELTTDIHCVTKWSRLGTTWRGVSLDTLLAELETEADFALVHSYGGYTTNLPLEDLMDGQAWIVVEHDGEDLPPEHGGPARLLVPHLYLWKSAKWVNRIELHDEDRLGFWESLGYHEYGDPWREQRYVGD
ncbi:sulfite oxidase-like oxidoreductase [Nocardioides sp. GXQ0305]|uniref:sulfite oxidase-like oxidoreductase n=1 Tax=Nocardioides sp. GXQ0305 TaxID=3423912 RepID=UPI003D7E412B